MDHHRISNGKNVSADVAMHLILRAPLITTGFSLQKRIFAFEWLELLSISIVQFDLSKGSYLFQVHLNDIVSDSDKRSGMTGWL
jgi:hypothetical protein